MSTQSMATPEVTICIPTYESEAFIARTLGFATGQTLPNIRILVSIDVSPDQTASICRSIAETDPRIEVYQCEERVGWAENVARLIRRVQTPYFFVYFHDDFLSPHYCKRLLNALQNNDVAASAHCGIDLIGRRQHRIPAHHYEDTPVARMLTMLSNDQVPGAPLRSMIRKEKFELANLLVPGIGPGEMFQAYGLHTAIQLAGPVVGVDDFLYTRWIRDDALTTSTTKPSCAQLCDVWLSTLERLWPYLENRLRNSDALPLIKHTFVMRAVSVILGAPDVTRAGVQDIWVRRPTLPRLDATPSLVGVSEVQARKIREFQTRVSHRFDQLA